MELENPGSIAMVAFVVLLVGLVLIGTSSGPTRDRASWHEPMAWALLAAAVVLVVLAEPTAAGNAPAPRGRSAPAPAPPATGPWGGGPG